MRNPNGSSSLIMSRTTRPIFGLDSCRNQLLALWTVYCMHNDLDVDTAMYDAVLLDLFNALSLEQRRELCRNYYPKFDDVMGVWLA